MTILTQRLSFAAHPALLVVSLWLVGAFGFATPASAELSAGAASVDITPERLPVLVNGGMLSREADRVVSRLFARAIVLDDGATRLAIVVVDSCMMPRALLDEAKAAAEEVTGIPAKNMLISATHTHSAPSAFGALGTDADPYYPGFLMKRLPVAIQQAAGRLEPARVGWAVTDASPYTTVRRWVRRPDRMLDDPFGNRTARANMHPGYASEDVTGPSGPPDPGLTVLSIQSRDGRPIALLANFAMHYFGADGISADYFGLFADDIKKRIAPQQGQTADPAFVGIMSQGTSGDIWRADYSRPKPESDIDMASYSAQLADMAFAAYQTIHHDEGATLAMAETEMPLRYRTPDVQRLEWARRILSEMNDRPPRSTTEVYAREAILLDQMQHTVLKLQAVRIGQLGITAIPNEVYALTGLKLKVQSPLEPTMNIELANGAEGYIPPPEQHVLGGYTTWPARSAGLEVQAEPRIVEALLQLLERVAGKPRRMPEPPQGPAAKATLALQPAAYWRFEEFVGPRAADSAARHDGIYEPGIVFYLDGPSVGGSLRDPQSVHAGPAAHEGRQGHQGHEGRKERTDLTSLDSNIVNRAAHFAGGRMRAVVPQLGSEYSVALWFWNGMPHDARPVTGYLFSRGRDQAPGARGDHLGIGGSQEHSGRLIFSVGDEQGSLLGGNTPVPDRQWNHVILVRDGARVRVYLNGNTAPEIDAEVPPTLSADVRQLFVGGRSDHESNFEGKIDEVAVYPRALTAEEILQIHSSHLNHPSGPARGKYSNER